jgi:hypothetical protein
VGENDPVILPKLRLFTPFRDIFNASNLRHGANGFTCLPKEGMLRNFSPEKSEGFGRDLYINIFREKKVQKIHVSLKSYKN